MRFGVDTGGTFTDVVARDAAGQLHLHKLLSTPDDPSEAIAAGVVRLDDRGAGEVVHGTTVATNALLERAGCAVVFVTTAGFEDLLELRRQNRPELYALHVQLPAPLTTTTVGVAERIGFDGGVLTALTPAEIARVVAEVRGRAPEAVAVCLLHAYANPAHERALCAALREALPGVHVSASTELVQEFREYERATTTVINGYVGPIMARYIDALGRRLPGRTVEILQSSGGRASLEEAARAPVQTVLSGPAGGVVGALAAASEVGLGRIITFDMGGTSTDVSLCEGEPTVTYTASIGELPLQVPTLDILTVGAGGGSIARVDPGGALRVGPQSAGATPGPAAYGRGGAHATVTDAHVVLGSLRPDAFLGGEMSLDMVAARRAVAAVGQTLGLGVDETARGILDVADASMVRIIKVLCSRRGRDPRDFALVAFGGAGGLHAVRLASLLEIDTVLVPAQPGLLSAFGMLHAPRVRRYATSVIADLSEAALVRARADLARQAGASAEASFEYHVDLRYAGQSFEIEVEAPEGVRAERLRAAFDALHEARFGYRDEGCAVQLVVMRLVASTAAPKFPATPARGAAGASKEAEVDLGSGAQPATIIAREAVTRLPGPAVITEYSGTTIVPAGWVAEQVCGHLVLRRQR